MTILSWENSNLGLIVGMVTARSQQLGMHGGYPLVNHSAKAGDIFEKNMYAILFVQDTDIKLYV